jgi:hypothetical protein
MTYGEMLQPSETLFDREMLREEMLLEVLSSG